MRESTATPQSRAVLYWFLAISALTLFGGLWIAFRSPREEVKNAPTKIVPDQPRDRGQTNGGEKAR